MTDKGARTPLGDQSARLVGCLDRDHPEFFDFFGFEPAQNKHVGPGQRVCDLPGRHVVFGRLVAAQRG